METSRHRTLHKELNEYLKTQTSDDKRYNMFPRKGNPGKDVKKNSQISQESMPLRHSMTAISGVTGMPDLIFTEIIR